MVGRLRIIAASIVFLFIAITPAYSLMPAGEPDSPESDKEEAIKIRKEKQVIIRNITAREDKNEPFDYAVKEDIAVIPEENSVQEQVTNKSRIDFLFLSIIVLAILLSYFFIR
ncbi:MAG: hypothetical protein WC312_05760 [Candidatus Omnitrophota bacterium]|jgi:hypothetical protein